MLDTFKIVGLFMLAQLHLQFCLDQCSVFVFTRKGDALNRGNYRGLKLIEQVMKV